MEERFSSSHTAEEHGGDKGTRAAVRRMGRERLRRYVSDIIRKQMTPLHDILRDHALQFLPAQSLLRFRSVSASWNRRIAAPFFAHTQSHTHRTLSGLFYHADHGGVSYLPFDPNAHAVPDPWLSFLGDTVCVAASSNGLVACRSLTFGSRAVRYYICNPATTHWTALPQSIHCFRPHEAALVFQPSVLNFTPGYYLVLHLRPTNRIRVFSSRTCKWRVYHIKQEVNSWGSFARGPGVTVGGLVYWSTDRGLVVSYDPVTDVLCNLGEAPVEGKLKWRLGEMDGRLCCVGVEVGKVEVHALEHGGSSWCKVGCFEVLGMPWPLAFEGRERRVVVWLDGKVVAIDVRSGKVSALAHGVPQSCAEEGVPYISSLAAVPKVCSGTGYFTCSSHSVSYAPAYV